MLTGLSRPAQQFSEQEIRARTAAFHEVYYYARLWERTHWFGVPTWKCPLDLWVVQEIIAETVPDVLIECGTALAGSAMYFASLFDLANNQSKNRRENGRSNENDNGQFTGRVISIDVKDPIGLPSHPRVSYVQGSSIDPKILEQIRSMIGANERVMLVLDSLHCKEHVLAELRLWGGIVSPGCYCIVEDTNINGHPVYTDYEPDAGESAFEAAEAYLAESDRFVIDRNREKLLLTFNPGGFLRCVASEAQIVGSRTGFGTGSTDLDLGSRALPVEAVAGFANVILQSELDTNALLGRLQEEMDSAKRLAIQRYETIQSLSIALAQANERASKNQTHRETAQSATLEWMERSRALEESSKIVRNERDEAIERASLLERQVASAEQRMATQAHEHREALESERGRVAELGTERARLVYMLDDRAARLKAAFADLDEARAERETLATRLRDSNALLAMARGSIQRLKEELMERDRTIAELGRKLQEIEVDVETLLVRVEHLESIEESRLAPIGDRGQNGVPANKLANKLDGSRLQEPKRSSATPVARLWSRLSSATSASNDSPATQGSMPGEP